MRQKVEFLATVRRRPAETETTETTLGSTSKQQCFDQNHVVVIAATMKNEGRVGLQDTSFCGHQ